MSFAKQAADLLTSDDAEADRGKQRSHWKDYLATGLGLGALGAGAYYGHKYWPDISNKINNAVSPSAPSLPDNASFSDRLSAFLNRDQTPGWLQRHTGVSSSVLGGLTGALGGEIPFGNYRLPWNAYAPGNTLKGLRDVSNGAHPGTELAEGVSKLDRDIAGKKLVGATSAVSKPGPNDTANPGGNAGGAGTGGDLARHAGSVLNPVSSDDLNHPLRKAYELATGKPYPESKGMIQSWREMIANRARPTLNEEPMTVKQMIAHMAVPQPLREHLRAPGQLSKIQEGLRIADRLSDKSTGDIQHPDVSPKASMRNRILQARGVVNGIKTKMNFEHPSDLANRFDSLKDMSASKTPQLRRMAAHGLLGAASGYLANRGLDL